MADDNPTIEMVKAPWTAQQVADLNAYQVNPRFHPYTCGGCDNRDGLIATVRGWICPWCDYVQDWCHAMSLSVPEPLRDDRPRKRPSAKDLEAVISVYDGTLYCLILAGLRRDLDDVFLSQIGAALEAHRNVLDEEPMSSPATIRGRMTKLGMLSEDLDKLIQRLEARCQKST